jgi:hypothetical protein
MTVPGSPAAGAYCRMTDPGAGPACRNCGAALDVPRRVSPSGWVEQPPIRDMARIRFGESSCQITGTLVPIAEVALHNEDRGVFFSLPVLLHVDPAVRLEPPKPQQTARQEILPNELAALVYAYRPGHLAVSADAAGEIVAVPLRSDQIIDVYGRHFLMASSNVGYRSAYTGLDVKLTKGAMTGLRPAGLYKTQFTALCDLGLLLLHAGGAVTIRDLAEGEEFSFNSNHHEGKIIWLQLRGRGRGRVAIQSVYDPPAITPPLYLETGASVQRW